MPEYKVVAEKGVTVDDVEFAKDEIIELEADALNVADLLAEGSIVEVEEIDPPAETGQFYNKKKIVGEVTDFKDPESGKEYKCFKCEDGTEYKLPLEEFTEKVGEKGL